MSITRDETREQAAAAESLARRGLARCKECWRPFPEEELTDGYCHSPYCNPTCNSCDHRLDVDLKDDAIAVCPACHTGHVLAGGRWIPNLSESEVTPC